MGRLVNWTSCNSDNVKDRGDALACLWHARVHLSVNMSKVIFDNPTKQNLHEAWKLLYDLGEKIVAEHMAEMGKRRVDA